MHNSYRDKELDVVRYSNYVHKGDDSNETDSTGTATPQMMVRASLRETLPPSLHIKSANLRVLDPIGHGMLYKATLLQAEEYYEPYLVSIEPQ